MIACMVIYCSFLLYVCELLQQRHHECCHEWIFQDCIAIRFFAASVHNMTHTR